MPVSPPLFFFFALCQLIVQLFARNNAVEIIHHISFNLHAFSSYMTVMKYVQYCHLRYQISMPLLSTTVLFFFRARARRDANQGVWVFGCLSGRRRFAAFCALRR
jgi:hypothetical protein